MGAADTVPGVSGGTIALIVGIYERLVTAIASLNPLVIRRFLGIHHPTQRKALKRDLETMDVWFLIALGLGIVTAIIVISGVMAAAMRTYRAPTNAFFFGLIGASAVILYREIQLDTPLRITGAICAVIFSFYVTGFTAAGGLPHSYLVIAGTGAIASSAMLLPGISGAAFMYFLGQYEYLVTTLHEFIGAFLDGGGVESAIEPGITVGLFIGGFGFGIITIAHIVRWALGKDRVTTLTILVSLMVGALRFPAEVINASVVAWTPASVVGVIIPALFGASLIILLDYYTDDLEYT